MCGIVGVAGSLEYKDEGLMKRLFLLDYFRGADSTGLAAVTKGGDVKVAKLASHPLDLFDMNKFKAALSGSSSKIFIGHNRAATRGQVNNMNAHPYECGHIVGVHNGTLDHRCFEELKKTLGEDFSTDSWAIFTAIERLGIEETVKMLVGAWSLVWYDRQENTLNFLRNKERPMWYAFTKDFSRLMWASEWEFIDAALKMLPTANNYEMLVEEGTGYKYWATEIDTHYKFDMSHLASSQKDKGPPKPVVKTLKGKDVAVSCGHDPFNRQGPAHGQWVNGVYHKNGDTHTQSSTPTSQGSGKTTKSHGNSIKSNIVSMFGTPTNPLAGLISREKFEEIARYGCSWCQATVDYDDVGVTVFERDDIIICAECSDHGKDKEPETRIYTPNISALQ